MCRAFHWATLRNFAIELSEAAEAWSSRNQERLSQHELLKSARPVSSGWLTRLVLRAVISSSSARSQTS